MAALTIEQYLQGIRAGDRQVLSRAITLVESTRPDHQELAQQLVEACLPHSGRSIRLGITGVPGVGKSTFIEAMGLYLIGQGKQPAVLAIDPSSARTKGSILGDKTRMNELASHPKAYIRPSPSAGSLGGVARCTREAMVLCEAAGFDVIIVETVGVGQSETVVAQLVDFFLLLMLAGAGDELQGIKRGIMEMADALVINKADGDNLKAAERAATEYRNALHLFPARAGGWTPKVTTCSALQQTNMDAVWQIVANHQQLMHDNQLWQNRRSQQGLYWFKESIHQLLVGSLHGNAAVQQLIEEMEQAVAGGQVSPYRAAHQVVALYLNAR